MRATQFDSTTRIVKLVDAINYFAESLVSTMATTGVRQPLQGFIEKTHWRAKQFDFELRTELRRLAAEAGPASPRSNMDLPMAFAAILESYQQALGSHITAHARAMLNRQLREMTLAYEEFAALCKAA
jgi:hypothetical protein